MEIIDVVRKLTGPIEPVGNMQADDKSFENLKARLELMRQLHKEVDNLSVHSKYPFANTSWLRAGKECDKYLNWLGVSIATLYSD